MNAKLLLILSAILTLALNYYLYGYMGLVWVPIWVAAFFLGYYHAHRF